jgi:ferric-dicitrate binding protein FerR (iron transport regulator)
MSNGATQALRDWKDADEIARSAERRLKEAWDAFDAGRRPPPSREALDAARNARALANTLLNEAMRLMAEAMV